MPRFVLSLAVVLLVAGCGAGAATTQAPAAPTAAPPAVATPSPEPACMGSGCPPDASPALVSARVTFDGTACVYTGPTAIAVPAVLTMEFAPTDEGYGLSIDPVLATTTRADVDRVNADESFGPAPGRQRPDFMRPGSINRVMGTSTYDTNLNVVTSDEGTYDQVAITCIAAPWGAGGPADQPEGRRTGALLKLVGE